MAAFVADKTTPVVAFKGFDLNFRCRGYQYTIGKTHAHDGPSPKVCKSGFHAFTSPIDVFRFYPPSASRYARVVQYGLICSDVEDSKVASEFITVQEELGISDLVAEAIKYTMGRCTTGSVNSRALATGDSSAASVTGDSSAASVTGDSSAASVTGDSSAH